MAVTVSRKLKWARTTFLTMLIMREKPSTSMLIKVRLSGESTSLAMLLLFWNGNVVATFVVKLNKLILLPTGERSSWSIWSALVADLSSVKIKLPPVKTTPQRF